jgi:hypothetical protein
MQAVNKCSKVEKNMKTRAETLSSENIHIKLGKCASLGVGIGAVGYGLTSIIVALIAPDAITWKGYENFIANYQAWPTILIVLSPFLVTYIYPILTVAMYWSSSKERRPFGQLAVIFACIYAAVLGSAYWVQLTFIPQSIQEGNTAGLQLWVMWHDRGIFWSYESFGYFAMGISLAFMGLSITPGRVREYVRKLMFFMLPFGFLFMVNEWLGMYPLATVMVLSLIFGWVILVSIISFSLYNQYWTKPA